MNKKYFSELIPELAIRAARATVSRLGFSNPALREQLGELFAAGYGQIGCFLGDPVFEATFGWKEAESTLNALAGGLLDADLVAALDKPLDGKSNEYRFPRDAHPYLHQLKAWQLLCRPEPASVVITSGTGSGKTECFMVPILNQLVSAHRARQSKLVGVEALFLYPLNALIQSQRERLNAWTANFGDGIRFCLYNGLTPERARQLPSTHNQVVDRQELRASPPPILVTNATMLEYMLVRAQDAPILSASQGKLKWIVLDEAHTYIGSQAAELALLLRRVLHAFDVRPEQVRFVATSATIGDEEAEIQLREFLAKLSGLSLEQVHVVAGGRHIPELPKETSTYSDATLDDLEALPVDTDARYVALTSSTTALRIRQLFVPPNDRAVQLSRIRSAIPDLADQSEGDRLALRWLDLLTSATVAKGKVVKSFLPLRVHLFHDVLQGLWACADPACSAKSGTKLESPDWHYGKVYVESRKHCDCGAPVYELRSCNDCNTTFLWARRALSSTDGRYRLLQTQESESDEFSLDIETPDEEVEASEKLMDTSSVLIANGSTSGIAEVLIDCETLVMDPAESARAIKLRLRDEMPVGDEGQMAIVCPECGAEHGNGKLNFRPAILGAPFLLGEIIPTLLEFCPDIDTRDDKPLERPMRGRRMISFTDSRQGTARIAAKLQQDSERNRVRGLAFLRVRSAGAAASAAAVNRAEDELREAKDALEGLNHQKVDRVVKDALSKALDIEGKEARLLALSQPTPVPFSDIVSWLSTNASDVKDRIYEYYVALDPEEFSVNTGRERLAKVLLTREFARRPKRVNSLETMGLVRTAYPKLDALTRMPNFPHGVPGLTLSDWKDFLKISLDFHVRENTFVDLPESWRKWGGQRMSSKQLLPPISTEAQSNRLKKWPQCNAGGRQSRLVRLLAYVLKIDPGAPTGRDAINAILRAAWDQLVSVSLLQQGGTGKYLSLNDISLAPIVKAWVCPVTRRVLDVTLRGVTPYLPEKAVSPKVAECRRVEIPQCDLLLLDYANEDDRIAAIRAWLNGNEQVEQLRIEGLWSDLSDRILEGSAFFRAAEHSAQQPGARLADYESKFKSGRINLLSCSTTMEMGVDIGGISVVAMNNVPPHPANYLQRAGRAGRRAETRSVALALCKNNPHDQNVLRNTLWPFTSRLPAPTVLLSSRIVIQRHINSMLLAEFMRAEMSGSGSAEKLNLEWWMLPKDSARIRRFCSWARCFEPSRQPMLARGLRSLLRHTPYDGIATLDNLTAEAARMAEAHALNWFGEFDAIETELSRFNVTTQSIEPAFKALSFQRKRLTGEYLLRELATGGFLPGYGFPTDISSFETLTCDEVARMKAKPEREGDRGRIDNRMRVRDLPSRDTVTALREYAPGAEVVIDGLVYRSSGITLNWHAPASNADVSEIQNIREAWRCRRCGSSGTHVRAAQISACPDCGASLPLDPEARFSYLQPAGFSVDLYDVPHNDVSVQTYVPVAAPWVNAQGEWRPLSNPALGFHRSSTSGIVFNHSAGSNDQGFAVCLYCGRAEPMELNGELPHVFFDRKSGKRREHRRLRGSQGGDTAICEGSNSGFAVMPALRLGHEARTDVLELLLCDTDSEPIKDRKIAYTLAVAIRNAIAKLLGVESSELGCDSKPVLMIKGRIGQAIVVFDKRAAGYCSSVSGRLQQVLTHARLELECQSSCQDACQHCLLDYETRFRVDDLDRHAALGFLTARWMADFALPIERAYFGVGASVAEHQSLIEAITRELAFPGGQPLHLFLAGRPEDWDIAGSSLRRCVTRWISSGEEVRIILSESAASCASLPDRAILHALQSLEGVSIRVGCAPSCLHGATVLAAIGGDGGAIAWASDSSSIAIPDSRWGDVAGASITQGRVENAGALADRLSFDVTPPAAGTVRLEISGELDGAVVGFGERVLSAIEGKLGEPLIPSGIEVASVTYHDRYLNSPLPLALLLDFVSCVRTRYKDQWDRQGFSLFVAPMKDKQGGLSPNRVWDDWPDSEVRDSVINAAFEYAGWEVELKRVDKRDVSHSRRLDFHLSDGKCIQVWFDQGFGYWRAQRSQGDNRFPFSQTVEVQAETVAGMRSAVEGQSYSTIMFIGR